MKHLLTLVAVFAITTLSFSQSPNWWKVDGNSNGSSTTFLGTTNAQPLIFKTNNVTRATFSSSGTFQVNSLVGTGNRLLQTDANGNIIPFMMGNSNEVLYGNGTWGTLPNIPTLFWQQHNTDLYYMNGKVGIGTNTPLVSLDVIGDARISNNLYVGGGVIITEKVNANAEVLTGSLKADSIKLDSTKAVYGYSIFKDKVKLENKLQVVGNTQIDGDFKVNGSFSFGNNKNLSYLPPSGTNPEVLGWGIPINIIGPILQLPYCLAPTSPTVNMFSGMIYSHGNNVNGGQLNVMRMGFDGANGIIDVAGLSDIDPIAPRLLINYYCGKDVLMCTGSAGGFVGVGKNFEVGNPQRDEFIAMNVYTNDKTGLFLTSDHSIDYGYNTKLAVNRDKTKAFAVYNNTTQKENFIVFGDGKVVIGGDYSAQNCKLSVNGTIVSKEIIVDVNSWPDYVFGKEYKLMKLSDLELYIEKNNSLPRFKTANEYQSSGTPLSEVVKLQQEKIEELTLYVIELDKKIEELKKK